MPLATAHPRVDTPGVTNAEPDKRLEIVFAEALRAVTHQQSVLDNIRTQRKADSSRSYGEGVVPNEDEPTQAGPAAGKVSAIG
jgi:hypothetical protein